MSKYEVKGPKDDFEIHKLEIEKTRRTVTLTILFTCILFLVSAGFYGIKNGNFYELSVVWSSIQTILGMVFGYYLGSKNG